jgi:hypothetical protein
MQIIIVKSVLRMKVNLFIILSFVHENVRLWDIMLSLLLNQLANFHGSWCKGYGVKGHPNVTIFSFPPVNNNKMTHARTLKWEYYLI